MSWIKIIPYGEAKGKLKKLYDRVKGPGNKVDNVLAVHSLRPHSLVGHMYLYKNVLHNSNNTLPKWYLELAGVYVSFLNRCDYCVSHHYEGLRRLLSDDDRAGALMAGIRRDDLRSLGLSVAQELGLAYAKQLTLTPSSLQEMQIEGLRRAGLTDGEILEINQLASYFNYVNRSVLGLGVNAEGDTLGLSPSESDDPDHWGHQ